jgi:hypothetical protein
MKTKFTKPPLSDSEKEKKAENFLNFSAKKPDKEKNIEANSTKNTEERVLKKEAVKTMLLRLPISMSEDITEVSVLSGISKNAVCMGLLRASLKKKLKELKSL